MPPLSIHTVIQVIEFWLRLATFLHEPLKQALLRILHDPSHNGLPIRPQQLYTVLSTTYKKKITKLKNKRILQQDQVDKLLPPNSTATDSSEFDITLICILIRNCTNLPAPLNGWDDKNPPSNDQSIAAFVIRAREWRNFVHHTEPKNITLAIFQQKWAEGANIVHNLGFQYDTNKLLNISLDPQHKTFLKPIFHYLNNVKNSLTQQIQTIDQQHQALTQQHNSLAQAVASNTQNITNLTKDTTSNTQDIGNLAQDFLTLDQQQKHLAKQQIALSQTTTSNTQEVADSRKQQQSLDQQQRDLAKQQAKLSQETANNAEEIANLMYQRQYLEQQQIFLEQKQKCLAQKSDSNTEDIKKLKDQQNLTLEQVSALLEQLTIIRDEVEDLKEKRYLTSGNFNYFF